MGNGTKVALVALLILMVVVIARFVRNDSEDTSAAPANLQSRSGSPGQNPGSKATAADAGKTKGITPPASSGSPVEKKGAIVGAQPPRPVPPSGSSLNSQGGFLPLTSGGGAPGGNTAAPGQPPGGSSTGIQSPTRDTSPPTVASDPPNKAATGVSSAQPPSVAGAGPKSPNTNSIPGDGSSRDGSGASKNGASISTLSTVRPPSPIQFGADGQPSRTELKTDGTRSANGTSDLAKGPGATAPQGPGSSGGVTHPLKPQPGLLAQSGASGFPQTHTIEKGDSYWTLSQKYYKDATLWQAIDKANPGAKLIPGKTLTIPEPPAPKTVGTERSTANDRVAPLPAPAVPPPGGSTDKTAKQEKPEKSLTPIERIARSARQRLAEGKAAQGKAADAGGTARATEYVVKKGDTLSRLAKRFYNDANKYYLIEEANDGLKYESLQEGAKITIPLLAVK